MVDRTPPPDYVVKSQSFAATIVSDGQGGKKLQLKSLAWYKNQVSKFKEGESVSVVIHNRRAKRSEQQNRFWWVYMTMIAQETGHSPEDVHEWAKGKFLTKRVVEVFGQPTRVKGSTTELSKLDFSELIMNVETATGIKAPPTEEIV